MLADSRCGAGLLSLSQSGALPVQGSDCHGALQAWCQQNRPRTLPPPPHRLPRPPTSPLPSRAPLRQTATLPTTIRSTDILSSRPSGRPYLRRAVQSLPQYHWGDDAKCAPSVRTVWHQWGPEAVGLSEAQSSAEGCAACMSASLLGPDIPSPAAPPPLLLPVSRGVRGKSSLPHSALSLLDTRRGASLQQLALRNGVAVQGREEAGAQARLRREQGLAGGQRRVPDLGRAAAQGAGQCRAERWREGASCTSSLKSAR